MHKKSHSTKHNHEAKKHRSLRIVSFSSLAKVLLKSFPILLQEEREIKIFIEGMFMLQVYDNNCKNRFSVTITKHTELMLKCLCLANYIAIKH